MKWEKCKLGNVMTLKRGHDLPGRNRKEGEIPIISSSGITGYHNASKAAGPGVVTGRYGTIGKVFYTEESYWPLNTSLYVIDFKKNDPKFISYFLENALRGYQSDKAAVPGIDRKVLHELDVNLPPVSLRKRIADILSGYDNLIENNKRRMALLESSARELYREWFVRLRFPGHAHCKITNGIPVGWEQKSIAEFCDFLKRGLAPRYDNEAEGIVINQKCIRNGRLDLGPARRQSKDVPKLKQLRFGDVLINSTGEGTLGRVAQYLLSIENCTVDSHITIVRAKDHIPKHFFGAAIQEFEPQLSRMGRGATNQTELSPAAVGELEILVPDKKSTTLFEETVAPISVEIKNLTEQNQKLRTARDLLLPKLMNGEIEV